MSKLKRVYLDHESCPECGDCLYVLTEDGNIYDGDIVYCCSCHYHGWISVIDDGSAFVNDDVH